MRNNTHALNVFPRERKLLKTYFLGFINLMSRDVLQLLAQSELNIQVSNLSLCSLRSSDPDLVNFYLYLSLYFLPQFLEKVGPCYFGNSSKMITQFPRLIIWLHATPVHSRLVYKWQCFTTLESPPQLGNSNSLHALDILGWWETWRAQVIFLSP